MTGGEDKMMEEVYVLVKSWQYDSGECGSDVYVFGTLENAKKRLKQEIIWAKQDMQQAVSDIAEDKDDMSYSVYEDGEYCYNHIDITIYQREIM